MSERKPPKPIGAAAAARGKAGAGAPFDPAAACQPPDDASSASDRRRALPQPGGPLPEDEMARLKNAASKPVAGKRGPAQTDPATKLPRK